MAPPSTPTGRLFVTEHGIDERGARYIVGDLDDWYEIQEGSWYGWPDFASGIPLDDPRWGAGGQAHEHGPIATTLAGMNVIAAGFQNGPDHIAMRLPVDHQEALTVY